MSDVNGELACLDGDMVLAPAVRKTLVALFPDILPRPSDADIGLHFSSWFCPGCGIPLGNEMRCPSCGKSIVSLRHHLIERHPHKGESEAYGKWKREHNELPEDTARRLADPQH